MSQAALNNRERGVAEKTPRRRSNGARLAGFIFLLAVAGTLCWSGWAIVSLLQDANRLPLSRLVVTGSRHYTRLDDIREAILASGPPGTVMTQNMDVILQQIKYLPWIKHASIRKQWPDTLKIRLTEYVPVARWNDLWHLDAQAKPFSVPAERAGSQKLPLLYGPKGSEQDLLSGYHTMHRLLAANGLMLKMVAMSARHSWQLALDNGVRLELGRNDHITRLQRFIVLYPILQQQSGLQVSYVDLRYDTGLAVGWAPVFVGEQQRNPPQAKQQ